MLVGKEGIADMHLQFMEKNHSQVSAKKRLWIHRAHVLKQAPGRDLWTYAGTGLLVRLRALLGTHAGTACSWSTWWKSDPCCSSLGRTVAHGIDSRWRSSWRTSHWSRRTPLPEQQHKHNELTVHSLSLCDAGGEKAEVGSRESWGKVFLVILVWFC